MKKFRKRINIQNATAFRLEYQDGGSELKEKEFKSYKAMEQFHKRQKDFLYLDCSRYAFVNNAWHRFIKIKSPFIFQSEINSLNKKFTEKIEAENLQNIRNEE